MNIQQWNQESFLEIQNKYRNLMKQIRQYQRQITSSYDESIFLTGEEQSFFKLLQSSCLDFDLILLEIITDLNCFQLDKIGDVIETMFKVQKTCLEKLAKQLQTVYFNSKAIKTKFTDNICKNCARSLEEKTTLTQNSMSKQINNKKDQKDAQEIQNFLGNDRQQFIRILQQALNQKTLSLSKRPADTEETLRSFLNDFKDRNDNSKQNHQKQKIARVLEEIRREQNIQVLAELTKTIRKSLLLSVKEPLLDYADKISLIKAEKIVAQNNAKKIKINQQVQTVETNVSEMIRKYENKIKTISSQVTVRKQRTKQLQKELLSALLSNSSHTQLMTEAKSRFSIAEQNSKKSEELRIEMESEFEQYKKHKDKEIESLMYNHDEEISQLRRQIKSIIQQSDQLRQQNNLLIFRNKGENASTQTFIVKYENQSIQTVQRQISKRMSKIRRQSKISQTIISDQQSMANIQNLILKPIFTLLEPTQEEKEKEKEKQKEKQKAISSFSFEPFIETIKKKTYQESKLRSISSQNQSEERHHPKKQVHLSENAVIEIKIEPDLKHNENLLTTDSNKGKLELRNKKRLPKFGHKTNLSQVLPETTEYFKTQHLFFGQSMPKVNKPTRTGACPILQKQIFKSPTNKKQNSALRFHNISYSRVQKIYNNKISSVHILPLQQLKTEEQEVKIQSQQQIVEKQTALKQIPQRFQNINCKVQTIDESQQVKKQLEIFKSLNQQMKIQKSKNITVKQLNFKRKQFYIDNKGEKVVIKDKLNEIKNVLLYEFQFLNRIGVIQVLAKLSKRILNHGRVMSQHHQRNILKQNSIEVTFSTKDFGLFGGYQNALKYEVGKGLWSSQLHTQLYNERVNNIVLYIQSLGIKQYEKISNFIMYPIRYVIFQNKQINIKSNHLRVLLNTIYNYHHSFCDNCNHIRDFLQAIGYM